MGGENKIKRTGKVNVLLAATAVLLVVLVLLLFYIVGVLIQLGGEKGKGNRIVPVEQQEHKTEFAAYFPECRLVESKCLSARCNKYFLCSDKKYIVCEVYDCGEDYGVGARDGEGNVKIKRVLKKENVEKVKKLVSRCRGKLKIVEQKCVEGKLQMKVRVSTPGKCEINGFQIGYKKEGSKEEKLSYKLALFSKLDDGLYAVTANSCENVADVVAVGEGVSIRER